MHLSLLHLLGFASCFAVAMLWFGCCVRQCGESVRGGKGSSRSLAVKWMRHGKRCRSTTSHVRVYGSFRLIVVSMGKRSDVEECGDTDMVWYMVHLVNVCEPGSGMRGHWSSPCTFGPSRCLNCDPEIVIFGVRARHAEGVLALPGPLCHNWTFFCQSKGILLRQAHEHGVPDRSKVQVTGRRPRQSRHGRSL